MATAVSSIAEQCRAARVASRRLAVLSTARKDAALRAIAAALIERTPEILRANALDMVAGREAGLSEALLDRLLLDEARTAGVAQAVERIAALPDPVGEVIDGQRLPNGLDVRRVRVPLGVVAVVYEARPNVTIDAAALCLKSGNAIVLRGSSAATHSNAVLAAVAAQAVEGTGLPEGSVTLVAGGGREELAELATQTETVDLIIPRGGEGLKAALKEVATVPVIYAASGNCHVFVDASADLDAAEAIVLNAKTQRPGVCNAMETLLVHRDAAEEFIPRVLAALGEAGVLVRGDARVLALGAPRNGSGGAGSALEPATAEDWDTEYLALVLAVGVVDSVAEAIEHIARHGSGHSEAILTRDTASARAFQLGVDAACVYVNASTRFTDGGEFGMGAEIGNSTQKLHARGPIGLRELCTFKYLIEGSGHVRACERAAVLFESLPGGLGILGGTFNPPHRGHLAVAACARAQLGLERVLLMPSFAPPHKPAVEDPGPEHRLQMCRLAVEQGWGGVDVGGVEACALEIERGGPSYTVDTLLELHARAEADDPQPAPRPTLILGSDMARTLPAWRRPQEIVKLADIAVAERPGDGRAEVLAVLESLGAHAGFLGMPPIDISSSLVRLRAARDEPVGELVGDAVAAYIAEHRLYREGGGDGGVASQ